MLTQVGELEVVKKPVKKPIRTNPNIVAKRTASAKLLKMAKKELAAEKWMTSLAYFNELWDRDPTTNEYLVVIAHILSRANMRKKAIEFTERALQACGPNNEVLMIVGELTHKMHLYDLQAKVFRIYVELYPEQAQGYENLALALHRGDRKDEGIEVLQNVIPTMPDKPALWNALALLVSSSRSPEEGLVFIDEAIRLSPDEYSYYDTKAFCYHDMGDDENAAKNWKKAYDMFGGRHTTLEFSLSIHYLSVGEFEKGFEWYENRLSVNNNARINWSLKAPYWDGKKSLKDKRIMLKNEQGIGDEMLFAALYDFVIEQAGEVYIGCEPRLVSLFKSSFPKAKIIPSLTTTTYGHIVRGYPDVEYDVEAGTLDFDYALPIASLPKIFYQERYDDIRARSGHLQSPAALRKKWKKRVDKIGTMNMRVGICWRSLLKSTDRVRHYSDIVEWGQLLSTSDIDFYTFQCGNAEEEVAKAEEKFGIKIHQFDDLNLRDDMADIAALMQQMDLIIGPATAAMHLASSVGTPAIWLLRSKFAFLYGGESFAFYANAKTVLTRFGLPLEQHLEESFAEFAKFSKEWSCPR